MAFREQQVVERDTQEGKYLTFLLGREFYALEIRNVIEIIGIQEITPIPDMPDYVKGFINLRGRVIPVMDARLRFNMDERSYDARNCIIVIDVDGVTLGLIVDMVNEVLEIRAEDIDSAQHVHGNTGQRFVKGLGRVNKQTKIILDAEKLIFEGAEDISSTYQEL